MEKLIATSYSYLCIFLAHIKWFQWYFLFVLYFNLIPSWIPIRFSCILNAKLCISKCAVVIVYRMLWCFTLTRKKKKSIQNKCRSMKSNNGLKYIFFNVNEWNHRTNIIREQKTKNYDVQDNSINNTNTTLSFFNVLLAHLFFVCFIFFSLFIFRLFDIVHSSTIV